MDEFQGKVAGGSFAQSGGGRYLGGNPGSRGRGKGRSVARANEGAQFLNVLGAHPERAANALHLEHVSAAERAQFAGDRVDRHVLAADNTLDDIVAGEKDEVGSGVIRQRHDAVDLRFIDIGRTGVEVADHGDPQRLSEDRAAVGARDVVLDNA